jgi:hypothetical protein
MGNSIVEPDLTDDTILDFEIADEALERAAGTGRENVANPTVPSAIICIPFEG